MMGTLVQNGLKDNTVQVADDLALWHCHLGRTMHGHSVGTEKIIPWFAVGPTAQRLIVGSAKGLG
jgi:hypothetical protein